MTKKERGKKMNNKIKILLILVLTAMLVLLVQSNQVQAALQSNGATPATGNLNDWIKAVRQMQATGGTLGLSDTINNNLTSSNKNMDIHMEKNTEYGAMVILSASSYGNPNKITNGQTTTGNASGVVMNLNTEWVAAARNDTTVGNMSGAAKRYWNAYTGDGSTAKKGDAMGETNGWHGSTDNRWFYHHCIKYGYATVCDGPAADCAFVRARGGSIFGFTGYSFDGGYTPDYNDPICGIHGPAQWGRNYYREEDKREALPVVPHYSRAAIVVGSGV